MSLKLAGYLFTGPFPIDTTAIRPNQTPVVYAVIAKGGPSWAPVFRVVDVGATPDDGLRFDEYPRRVDWTGGPEESLGLYLLYMKRSEYSAADRQSIASQLRQQYDPPRGLIE
jgi:hypothetical protein